MKHPLTDEALRARFLKRFTSKVDRRGPDECWPWKGSTFATCGKRCPSYVVGNLSIRVGGKWTKAYAHRTAYELAKGPIPDGLTVDHLCFNPICCNPAHLRLLTRAENAGNKSSGWHERQKAGAAKRRGLPCKRAA